MRPDSDRHLDAKQVQPILAAFDTIAAHSEACSLRCSNTIRTARSRSSGEYLGDVDSFVMAPVSQELEPPANPERFSEQVCDDLRAGVFAMGKQRARITDPVPIDLMIQRAGTGRQTDRTGRRVVSPKLPLLSPNPADVSNYDWYWQISAQAAAVYDRSARRVFSIQDRIKLHAQTSVMPRRAHLKS